jgi:type IV secretion system protein VirB5
MKLKKMALALAIPFILSVYVPGVGASGIPVVDGAHITSNIMNHIENITQWTLQAKQMIEQIEAMEKEFQAATGSRGMGAIPDQLREQLKNIIADSPGWEGMRTKYPAFENAPKASAVYDVIAKGEARMKGLQDIAERRLEQVNSLMQRIDSAGDPAAKQDLANRLAIEQAAIQAAANLAQIVAQKQEIEIRHAEMEAGMEFACQEFKRDC